MTKHLINEVVLTRDGNKGELVIPGIGIKIPVHCSHTACDYICSLRDVCDLHSLDSHCMAITRAIGTSNWCFSIKEKDIDRLCRVVLFLGGSKPGKIIKRAREFERGDEE